MIKSSPSSAGQSFRAVGGRAGAEKGGVFSSGLASSESVCHLSSPHGCVESEQC